MPPEAEPSKEEPQVMRDLIQFNVMRRLVIVIAYSST
jgi:hypothetical protein